MVTSPDNKPFGSGLWGLRSLLFSCNHLSGVEKQWEKFTDQTTAIPSHEVALQLGKEILYMR